jgi:hypothetical protein
MDLKTYFRVVFICLILQGSFKTVTDTPNFHKMYLFHILLDSFVESSKRLQRKKFSLMTNYTISCFNLGVLQGVDSKPYSITGAYTPSEF